MPDFATEIKSGPVSGLKTRTQPAMTLSGQKQAAVAAAKANARGAMPPGRAWPGRKKKRIGKSHFSNSDKV
jgi:hypothetical protein